MGHNNNNDESVYKVTEERSEVRHGAGGGTKTATGGRIS